MRRNQKLSLPGMALATFMAAAGTSAAQSVPTPMPPVPAPSPVEDRLAEQERRIANGLKDGSLTAGEAARLQREESRLNREWARDKADGTITPQERARMERHLNRASRDIYRERHDAQQANPNNPINQRLGNQADRIANGIQNGSLTNREAARLERGESRIAGEEARFRQDGHLGPGERAKLNRDLNRESRGIYRAKHNGRRRPS